MLDHRCTALRQMPQNQARFCPQAELSKADRDRGVLLCRTRMARTICKAMRVNESHRGAAEPYLAHYVLKEGWPIVAG
jgi:hypothetical protein